MWRPGPSRREAPTVPPEEAWAAVRVASRAPEGCQRRGRRLQVAAVARRGQRAPRGPARWVVVQARRALAQEREAAWERAAARPTGCWRAAGSTAPSAVEGLWAARLRLPWQRRAPCAPVPAEAECTDGLPAELVPPPDGDDRGELGLLMPGEPEGPPPRLGADGAAGAEGAGPRRREQDAGAEPVDGVTEQQPAAVGSATGVLPCGVDLGGSGANCCRPVAEHRRGAGVRS